MPCTRAVFGGRAIELAGRVIHPDYQGQGIGTTMLADFLDNHPVDTLATYTRNPAVLKMIGNVASQLYPLDQSPELEKMASEMPYATHVGDATYHIDRYDEGGLFQGGDPANSPLVTAPHPLRERFAILKNERHALIAVARRNTRNERL